MQNSSSPNCRPPRLAIFATLVATAVLGVAVVSAAGAGTPPAAIKQCRRRFSGAGKKQRQAEQRCIEKARARSRKKATVPAESSAPTTPSPSQPGGAEPPTAPTSPPGPVGGTPQPGGPSGPVDPPVGPSGPESPPPIELLGLGTRVDAGSSVHLPPPPPLTSLSTIELSSSANWGLDFGFEEGDLVISAASWGEPGRFRVTFSGTGCTASECGRQFVIHVRISVETPGVFPTDQVIPHGPTSGPAGFGPVAITPSCSEMTPSFDGWSSGTRRVAAARESFPVFTPPDLPVGSHQVSFFCGGGEAWRSPGFALTVTGPPVPLGLESSTVSAGEELIFTSGGTLGAAPCPPLAGVEVSGLILELNTSEGSILVTRNLTMPDGRETEGLMVPTGAAAGSYSASERCSYSNSAGEGAHFEFDAARQNVTVD